MNDISKISINGTSYDITTEQSNKFLAAYSVANIEAEGTWEYLCEENETFMLEDAKYVKYGSINRGWIIKRLTPGTYTASNNFFGFDPDPGENKKAYSWIESWSSGIPPINNVVKAAKFATSSGIELY